MALTIWDVATGVSREATQEDLDVMQAKLMAFGRLSHEWRTIQDELSRTISGIHEKHMRSAALSGDL